MGTGRRRNEISGAVYLDTHAAVWLCLGDTGWLSKKAQQAIDRADLRVSPMVLFELDMLHEKKRITKPGPELLDLLRTMVGVSVCDAPWLPVIETARRMLWTRDPFDRLIVANAALQGAHLITADATILNHYGRAMC